MLISLRERAGWSASLLFVNLRRQVFSHRDPNHLKAYYLMPASEKSFLWLGSPLIGRMCYLIYVTCFVITFKIYCKSHHCSHEYSYHEHDIMLTDSLSLLNIFLTLSISSSPVPRTLVELEDLHLVCKLCHCILELHRFHMLELFYMGTLSDKSATNDTNNSSYQIKE